MTIELTAEAQSVLARLKEIPRRTLQGIARGLDKANESTVSVIQREFLSYPKHGPPVPDGLRVQTNRLRSSIRATRAVIRGDWVVSSIGSNIRYAPVHEFGFSGEVHVRAHSRRTGRKLLVGGNVVGRIVEAAAGLLTKAGKPRNETESGPVQVRAHSRRVEFLARAPIRRGILRNSGYTTQVVSEEIIKAVNDKGGIT